MNRRSMIATGAALVLLLGGAAGAYYYVDHKKSTEEAAEKEEKDSLKLMAFDSNNVKGIDITNSDGYFYLSLSSSGDWVIDDTDFAFDFTPNSYYLNVIAASMGKLTADHKVEKKDSDLSKYGLDKPVTVVCHTSDEDYTVLVGSSSVTNEFCYVMLPDDDTIYCIDNQTGLELQGNISDLRDPYMLKCNDNEIMEFSLMHNGECCYDIERNIDGDTIWSLKAPNDHDTEVAIDAITVNTILTNIVRVQSVEFKGFAKGETDLAEYGLDEPAYNFMVKTDEKTYNLSFPEFSDDDEKVLCFDHDTYEIFAISINNAAFLKGKWQDLTAKQVLSVPFMSTAELEINIDGETHKLTIDHDKPSYIFDDIDVTALGSDDAAANFEYLYASVSEISHGDFLDGAPEIMGKPACDFVYKFTDGKETSLSLVPIDDENYWAYIDGDCMGMTVKSSEIKGSNGCLNFIEKLTAAIDAAKSGS